ncbi:MAG: type I methionyl aminopeptidase [Gammaproteobacteria bacterium]|nr:type I methionyl aminopeptidase [Gammaproteobacteria bacterium]MBU1489312.1 type I methionyl aminopeptidase [Gammaproteobacteria bacterium]MBU2066363.1 type I methionyl aminopeptidase [Gammaproteobacteria bacterium]MBU2137820.1 type I methionyl aminopeptidase [Gammaproteobacteria bacterium]MBU2215703.1 type I methionyl aminopeptidase [Gammaproteobacteria bacterium]
MRSRIPLNSAAEIACSKAAGSLAAEVLAMIAEHVKPGITTERLDQICHDYIVQVQKAIPGNIGYQGYPKTVLTSVNDVVCHGIPSATELKDGDILNIDVAVVKDGWYGDTSRMYVVGQASPEALRLVKTTYEAMCAGIRAVRPGATLGDIGHAIEQVAAREGFSVVRDFCGHGIGKVYHDAPQILHFGRPGQGLKLKAGMIFTIEPMLNAGKWQVKTLADGWTVKTKDQSLSAQWEHMVAVTPTGFEVLSPWPDSADGYQPITHG